MASGSTRFVAAAVLTTLGTACSPPPSVRAVDAWLTAYAAGDVETMVANTVPADRDALRAAIGAVATSSLALALPPRPIEHELLEIERKEANGSRHVVLCRVTMKNPLPYMSERVGQPLDIPKQRTRRRRFLSVRGPDGRWGVKLDLERVMARTQFVASFERALAEGRLDAAEALLADVPDPPDEANAQATKDRLVAALRGRLDRARSKAAVGTKTATVPKAAPPTP